MKAILFLTLAASAFAQLTLPNAVPMPTPEIQYLDANGAPLAGAKLCTYAAGTTTPLATYTDSTAVTPNSNPIVLDSAGRASVWVGPKLYKFVLRVGGDGTCTTGVVQWTQDNVADTTLYFTNYVKTVGTATLISYTNPASGAIQRTQQSKNNDALSVKDFGAVCDGSADDTAALVLAVAASSLSQAVYFPSGTCTTTAMITSTHPITWISDTSTTLQYTGGSAVDAVLKMDGGPATVPHGALMEGTTLQGFVFDGGGQANAGLLLQAVVSAQVSWSRVINTVDVGFYLNWAQQLTCDHCMVSKDFDPAANMPVRGIVMDHVSSANYFTNVNIDHVSSHGIDCVYCINTTIIGGTSEGNGGAGWNCNGAQCFNNTLIQVDLEVNTGGDLVFQSGSFFNTCIQCNSFSIPGVTFSGSAHENKIIGGFIGGGSTAAVNTFGNRLIGVSTITVSGAVWTDLGQNVIDRIYNNFTATFIEPYSNYQLTQTMGNSPVATQKIQHGTPLPSHAYSIWGDQANNWIGFDCQDGFGSCWFTYPKTGGMQFIGETSPDVGAINDGAIKNHQWCFGGFCQNPLAGLSFDFYDQAATHTIMGIRATTGQGGFDLLRFYGYNAVTPPIMSKVASDGTWIGAIGTGGTTFTVAGCGAASPTGGATGGTFTVTTTGSCTATITMGDTQTAAHGWNCSANNVTTANLLRGVPNSTTTAKLIGTTVSGDTLSFACSKY